MRIHVCPGQVGEDVGREERQWGLDLPDIRVQSVALSDEPTDVFENHRVIVWERRATPMPTQKRAPHQENASDDAHPHEHPVVALPQRGDRITWTAAADFL
jgi:hypothetical protein